MEGSSEVAASASRTAAGRFTVPDAETGFHHSMYAVCPPDGAHAPVRRVVCGAGRAITQVTVLCPECDTKVLPAPEGLHLH